MIITLYKLGKDGKTRYYTIHDRQPVLDSPYTLCASWRIGLGKERERLHRFQTLLEKDKTIRRLITGRVKEGYRILYSFTRSGISVGKNPADQAPATGTDMGSSSLQEPGR
jgi:hypothetical protein